MTKATNWVEKHRPETYDDIQGNNSAIEDIRDWIEDWEAGDAPQLLIGDAGTGKTSTAYVVAEQEGYELNQVDASTARTTEDIQRITNQMRAGDQLVLLDEVDSWHHSVDLGPLRRELQDPANPVMLTANVEYDVPEAIKGPSEVHEYKLNTSSRRAKIKEIAKREGVPLDEKDLERLVDRPDLRSAINDLQLNSEMGIPIGEDERSWEQSEFAAMDDIIQQEDASDVDTSPDWLTLWLDQNVRKEYRGLELAAAYDALSRADRYLGKAQPGDYRPWRYAGELAESVADLRITEPYTGWIRWSFPTWVQSSPPDVEDETEEAALYRELKEYGRPGFSMSGGYVYFRETVLPILRRLPDAERLQLVVDEGLTEEAAAALDVSSAQYADATVEAEATAGEELDAPTMDATEADW